MKKLIITIFLLISCVIMEGTLVSNNAFAQDVWAYTDKNGSEYYVKTETANYYYYEGYDYLVVLRARVTITKYTDSGGPWSTYYYFHYDRRTHTWTGKSGEAGYKHSLHSEDRPELYPIWLVARKYAR